MTQLTQELYTDSLISDRPAPFTIENAPTLVAASAKPADSGPRRGLWAQKFQRLFL